MTESEGSTRKKTEEKKKEKKDYTTNAAMKYSLVAFSFHI